MWTKLHSATYTFPPTLCAKYHSPTSWGLWVTATKMALWRLYHCEINSIKCLQRLTLISILKLFMGTILLAVSCSLLSETLIERCTQNLCLLVPRWNTAETEGMYSESLHCTQKVFLQHNNDGPHTSTWKTAEIPCLVIDHPPYSLNMAPLDFPTVKKHVTGHHFFRSRQWWRWCSI